MAWRSRNQILSKRQYYIDHRQLPVHCSLLFARSPLVDQFYRSLVGLFSFNPAADGSVSTLLSVQQLQAALNAAKNRNQVVALKFIRKGCKACASTVEQYAETAREYKDAGQFYTVPYEEAASFIKMHQIRAVPCGHVYADNKLQESVPMNEKTWEDFRARLDRVREGLQQKS